MKTLLRRIIKNKDTKEETIVGLEIRESDILCLYQDRSGVYVTLSHGKTVKVDHKLFELQKIFGL